LDTHSADATLGAVLKYRKDTEQVIVASLGALLASSMLSDLREFDQHRRR
jgi:hypothetical protein